MKIAFVSDDGRTISAHMGRAIYYVVVTLEDHAIAERRLVAKEDFHAQRGHAEHHSAGDREHRGLGPEAEERHRRMFAPIAGCEMLVARGMGYGAQRGLQQLGIQPLLTDLSDIDEALDAYLRGDLKHQPERVH